MILLLIFQHQWPIQYHHGEDTWSDDRDSTGTVEEFSFDHRCHGCGYGPSPHTAQVIYLED